MTEKTDTLLPVTGAWREEDPIGHRKWQEIGSLQLESNTELPAVRIAYETWGNLAPDHSNAILVCHALTGDSHAAGIIEPGHLTPGWWDGLIGSGRSLDTDRWFVVAPNVLGGCQGTTGPASLAPDAKPWGSRFPFLTIRDQVLAEAALADALGITTWAAIIGGSMGGMRALEWAVTYPYRVKRLGLVASPAATSAEQIGWTIPQLNAIRGDSQWRGGDYYDSPAGGGPHRGLAVARQIAQITYRTETELQARFGSKAQGEEDPWRGGRYAIESYLDHHAIKLIRRFDANSYVHLTEAMNTHNIGRDRGGTATALQRVTADTLVIGVDSDRLYPLYQQQELVAGIPSSDGIRLVQSPYGHDAFLIETGQVGEYLRELLKH